MGAASVYTSAVSGAVSSPDRTALIGTAVRDGQCAFIQDDTAFGQRIVIRQSAVEAVPVQIENDVLSAGDCQGSIIPIGSDNVLSGPDRRSVRSIIKNPLQFLWSLPQTSMLLRPSCT